MAKCFRIFFGALPAGKSFSPYELSIRKVSKCSTWSYTSEITEGAKRGAYGSFEAAVLQELVHQD
jgi:hypothetical protein